MEYRRRQDGRWYQQRSKSRETPTDSNTYTHPDSVSGPDGGPCSDPPFDNRHVVPYNALLLLKYQCHVNVELCSSIKSVKYVYKYVYKGQTGMTLSYYLEVDGKRVTPSMTGPSTGPAPPGSVAVFDEIEDFVSGRSVCAHEAAWRLLGFNLQEQLPNTYPLCLHLPGEQTVHLPAEDQQHIMEEIVAGGCGTPLTAFFRLNADFNRYAEGWGVDAAICHFGVDVSTLLYHSVPKYFTIRMDTSTRNCKWHRRKHGCTRVQRRLRRTTPQSADETDRAYKARLRALPEWRSTDTVGRVRAAAPSQTEEFSLRLLLVSVPGPTSFEYLRTYNGVQYASFREAAVQRGLCDGDGEYVECMEEAVVDHSPRELRALFVTIVVHCGIANPLELYNRYSMQMAEDFVSSERNNAARHASPVHGDDSEDDEVEMDLNWRRRHRHRSTAPVGEPVSTPDPEGAVSDDPYDSSGGGSN